VRDPSAVATSVIYQLPPAGGNWTMTVWTRDHAGDAPTGPGLFTSDSGVFDGLSLPNQAAYTRNRWYQNGTRPGAGNGVWALWVTGQAPGNVQTVTDVGSRDTFGPMMQESGIDYPFIDGNVSASDALLPAGQISKFITATGDLDVSWSVAPKVMDGAYVASGWMFSIDTPDGVIGVERDQAANVWKYWLRGAVVLTMPATAAGVATGTLTAIDGQRLTARIWYHSADGAIGMRLSCNGAVAYDIEGVTAPGALSQPTAIHVGSKLGVLGFFPVQHQGWVSRIKGASTDFVPEGLVLGDSDVACFDYFSMVPSHVYTPAEASTRPGIKSLAVPGNTILDQRAAFDAYPHSATVKWVLIQVGLNDVFAAGNVAGASAAIITRYQALVNHIPSVNPSAPIIVATMTPGNAFWENAFGAPATFAKQNWQAVNDAIAGMGGTPITGVSARVTSHTAALDRNPLVPTGFLSNGTSNGVIPDPTKPFYDQYGDGLHYNDPARRVVGSFWRSEGLVPLGLL
jgi:hypothetical protein